jgi:hypothetical protein
MYSKIARRKMWPGMRNLEGIVESPVLRPDGSILDQPGYDNATGLLYQPNATYPSIGDNPTKEDAIAAAIKLIDVVCDFPFKSEAHRSAWLAALLTPLARYAYAGPSPLFLMDANVRSSGKTLLADIVGEIVGGHGMARTPQAVDESEEIKRQDGRRNSADLHRDRAESGKRSARQGGLHCRHEGRGPDHPNLGSRALLEISVRRKRLADDDSSDVRIQHRHRYRAPLSH